MPHRVAVVHHGFIPDYRVRLYELLQEQGDIEYVVFHGQAPPNSGHRAAPGPFSFPNVRVTNRSIRLASKSAIYQPIFRRIMGGGFDALVLGTPINLLVNTPLLLAAKARRRPVLLWGQGHEKAEMTGGALRTVSVVASALKSGLAGLADGYLVYTDSGRKALLAQGLAPQKTVVLHNTLDIEAEKNAHAALADADARALRDELGLRRDSVVLLYLGRVYAEKRLGDLCELVGALSEGNGASPPVEAVVLGDGPDMQAVRERAVATPGVHLRGAVHDRDVVARHMRVASALVMPGKVGLAVNHAFAHGVPVLTRASDLHAAEVEFIEPGRNGLIVEGEFGDFVAAVADFVQSPELQTRLADGALRTRDRLSLEAMAKTFHAAVQRALAANDTHGEETADVRHRRAAQV